MEAMPLRWSVVIACAAATVAACSSAPAPATGAPPEKPIEDPALDAAPAVPQPVTGTYINTHTIHVVCQNPDWCEEEVDDVMRIREVNGGLELRVELVQANAHTCTFENVVNEVETPEAGRRWRFEIKEESNECVLTLDHKDGSLSLNSEGCRYYCGARAHLMATFSDEPNDRDPNAYDCTARCKTVGACNAEAEGAKRDQSSCISACYKREGDARATWDECVRRAGSDCTAISSCSS